VPLLFVGRVVVVGRTPWPQGGLLTSLAVNLVTGAASHENSMVYPASAPPQVVHVRGLPDTVFAVASPTSGGNVRMSAWRVDPSGVVTGQSPPPAADVAPLSATDDWKLVEYREGGAAVIRTPGSVGASASLSAWSVTLDSNGLWQPRLVMAGPTGLTGAAVGACRVPDDGAEGDFLVGQMSSSTAIRLAGVRSAPRP